MQVTGGGYHTIGLRADGTAIAWGYNDFGQCNVPAGETFVQVDAGYGHTIGLREDGTAIAWGWNNNGQCNVPAGETFVQVDAGRYHTIGLRSTIPDRYDVHLDGSMAGISLHLHQESVESFNGDWETSESHLYFTGNADGINLDLRVHYWGNPTHFDFTATIPFSVNTLVEISTSDVGMNGYYNFNVPANGNVTVAAGDVFVFSGSFHADNPDGHLITSLSYTELPPTDADGDGVTDDIDNCDLYNPDQLDCNGNGVGDVCDIAYSTSDDCDANGVPDECQPDCNLNGIADACDLTSGSSFDCDQNGVPDECQPDCDGDGWIDPCDSNGDCDGDGIPDNCETDCNTNGLPDDCEVDWGFAQDCNSNGIPDECDIADGSAADCNGNDVPDTCDIAAGEEEDCDGDAIPDSCSLSSGPTGETKLVPDDGATSDWFGKSVSISGNIAVIGSPNDDGNFAGSGSAYVFHFNGTEWVQQAKLLPSDGGGQGFNFGWDVSASGNAVLIGAYATDDNGNGSGAAYVFRFNGSEWHEEAKLLPNDGDYGDNFGDSVSISGDTVVVGAYASDHVSGAAYIFKFDGNQWSETEKLTPSDPSWYQSFGESVSISGNTVVIGANADDERGENAGAAYVFRFDGNAWTEQTKLLASDGASFEYFGFCVGIAEDTVVIGAPFDDDNGLYSGSAYIFKFNGNQWTEETKLLASDGEAWMTFGYSVATSGDSALISSWPEASNGATVGSGYLYSFDSGVWTEEAQLQANDGVLGDFFGQSVALTNGAAIVGAFQSDDMGTESGSAYVFGWSATSDCDTNGLIDSCELEDDPTLDCDEDGVLDVCQTLVDCNNNSIPDSCDLLDPANDQNNNGEIDSCECLSDINEDGAVTIDDLLAVIGYWGSSVPAGDLNFDGTVDIEDLLIIFDNWGACP